MSSIALKGRVGLGEAAGSITMPLMIEFQEAVRRDDVERAKTLLSTCPEIETWTENPLHFACQHGSTRLAMEIGRGWPNFAISAKEAGDIAMHLVSAKGDVEMVEFLGKLNPGSCLHENKSSRIPLHVAAEKGHCLVIKKLVSLCPDSLEKFTSKQETVFHLAENESAFLALVDEIKKHNVERLLNQKDDEGNTALHIAAFKRLPKIVKLLLHENSSSSSRVKIQINSKNKRGQTALDISRVDSADMDSRQISQILEKAADDELSSLESRHNSMVPNKALTRYPVAMRNVLLVVLVMTAAATFTMTYDLPETLLKELNRSSLTLHASASASASDVISARLPSIVYLMVFNSAGFLTSMALISYLIWPLPLRSIILFIVVCTCIVYVILLKKTTPKFSVRVGNFSFSSITLVLSSALAFIFFGVTIIIISAKMLSSVFNVAQMSEDLENLEA